MTPEYLRELADKVDPDQLWRTPVLEQASLPEEQRWRLDAGVALRRHAAHVADLRLALDKRESVLLIPLSPNSAAHRNVPTPDNYRQHQARWQPDDQPIDTAPKDREILVFNTMTGWYRSRWTDGEWPMRGWDGKQGTWYPRPTHWKELSNV
ncbi:MAG: hypothetical protein IIZ92_24930 [Aquincola sp.]|nr:hypothetical protein [Aquincola sp.]